MYQSKDNVMRAEYKARINAVQDYIAGNLSKDLSLAELAQVANFSMYHFHRIFYSMVGETLFQYIQRIRLEKAAFLLRANPQISITEVAFECGFSNQASFAKAFRKHFHSSASTFKKQKEFQNRNLGKVLSEDMHYNDIRNQRDFEGMQVNIPYTVEVKKIPAIKVIYIRHTGPFKEDAALFRTLFGKLQHWAQSNDVGDSNSRWITLIHDDPGLTDEDKIKISVCMTIDRDVKVDGEIGKMVIPGGRYAVGSFEIDHTEYQKAWTAMCAGWLPASGYLPDDHPPFELYESASSDSPEGKQKVKLYIPVKPM